MPDGKHTPLDFRRNFALPDGFVGAFNDGDGEVGAKRAQRKPPEGRPHAHEDETQAAEQFEADHAQNTGFGTAPGAHHQAANQHAAAGNGDEQPQLGGTSEA